MFKLSVIIPAHNEEKYVGDCLKSVLENAPFDILEIIVVDNASTDKTAEVAGKFPKVKVVFEPKKGSNYARERGFLESRGDILAYVDADVHLPKNWFKTAYDEFNNDKELICLSGPCEFYDISKWKNFLSKVFWIIFAMPVYYFIGYMILGANFVVKREALLKIGGFNTDITFYGDDADTARRLNKIGKTKFSPSFLVAQSGRRLTTEGIIKMGLRYGINYFWIVLFKKPFTKT